MLEVFWDDNGAGTWEYKGLCAVLVVCVYVLGTWYDSGFVVTTREADAEVDG